VRSVPAGDDGIVSAEAVRNALAPDVAAIMLTNPNTCGLFEREISGIAEALHGAGAYFIAMALILTPSSAKRARAISVSSHAHQPAQDILDPAWRRRSGRGSGRVVVAACALCAGPFVKREGVALRLVEHAEDTESFGACARSTADGCSCAP